MFGSIFYTEEPLIALANTVAMINLDMIGHNNPDTLVLRGGSSGPRLTQMMKKENKKIGFKIPNKSEKSFFGRSDYASFVQKGTPVLCVHTNDHEDLHKVSDNAEKSNIEKLARVARLCYCTMWELANTEERIDFVAFEK